jgi:hypothetical protein
VRLFSYLAPAVLSFPCALAFIVCCVLCCRVVLYAWPGLACVASCRYAVLSMMAPDSLIPGVKELAAVPTAITALRSNAYDQPFAQAVLMNLLAWAQDRQLAMEICSSGMNVVLAVTQAYGADPKMLTLVRAGDGVGWGGVTLLTGAFVFVCVVANARYKHLSHH